MRASTGRAARRTATDARSVSSSSPCFACACSRFPALLTPTCGLHVSPPPRHRHPIDYDVHPNLKRNLPPEAGANNFMTRLLSDVHTGVLGEDGRTGSHGLQRGWSFLPSPKQALIPGPRRTHRCCHAPAVSEQSGTRARQSVARRQPTNKAQCERNSRLLAFLFRYWSFSSLPHLSNSSQRSLLESIQPAGPH